MSTFGYVGPCVVILLSCLANELVSGYDVLGNCSLCKVPKHFGHEETLEKLKPFCGLRFSVEDQNKEYSYSVGICVSGEHSEMETDAKFKTAAVIQTKIKGTDKSSRTLVGSLDKTELMSGSNWINLEYEGGTEYGNHCNGEPRRTIIMITCAPEETVGKLMWMQENRNKSGDCYYLFELGHKDACYLGSGQENKGLSPGSIVCIVLGSIVVAYLVFGILYMRLVKGAKGVRQIPNYDFWRDFGNLQADGCDLICRCSGNRYLEAKPYHGGIGDHAIESANDDNLDDHLLPM